LCRERYNDALGGESVGDHTWLIPALWASAGILAALALASTRWFRALFSQEEATPAKAVEQHATGVNNTATAVGSIGNIGAGASVVIGSRALLVNSPGKLTMLFVKLWEELPMREDLKGQHLLEASLRSDYSISMGVEFIRWTESGGKIDAPPVTYFMEFRGIKYSHDKSQYGGLGPSKMVVNPGEAFKVTMRVYHTVISWPHIADSVPDDHPIGVLVLRVDGK
jgi:hypothetical protein